MDGEYEIELQRGAEAALANMMRAMKEPQFAILVCGENDPIHCYSVVLQDRGGTRSDIAACVLAGASRLIDEAAMMLERDSLEISRMVTSVMATREQERNQDGN
jgi:hypothetical protein